MSNIMDPAMLSQADSFMDAGGVSFGEFFKGFLGLFVAMAMMGEMVYDGDFSSAKTAPAAVARSCVKTFRSYPFKMSFQADVTPVAAAFEGMDGTVAVKQLRDAGFVLGDATAMYADKMVYNDRMIFAARDASHLWPEVLRADSCEVGLFLRNNRVTGVFAKAVRRGSLLFRMPELPGTFPLHSALGV